MASPVCVPGWFFKEKGSFFIIKTNNVELTITRDKAKKAYNEADKNGKQLLSNLFGEGYFNEDKKTYVRTFADVCDEAGRDIGEFAVVEYWKPGEKAARHLSRLMLIAEVFNEGWKPDMADTQQNKFYPWFNIVPDASKPSGFGLSFDAYVCGLSISSLGARPYFKDRETAIYVGKQFLQEFEGWAQQQNLAY